MKITEYVRPNNANLMAAVMAWTNMGMRLDELDKEVLRHTFYQNHAMSIDGSVSIVCQSRIEGDESYDAFFEEAQGWAKVTDDAKYIQITYPKQWEWYKSVVDQKRWTHARAAMDGASNQRLLSRVLHEAIREVQDEGGDLKTDAAVQVILHQLSHVLGQSHILDLSLYNKYMTEIAAKLD